MGEGAITLGSPAAALQVWLHRTRCKAEAVRGREWEHRVDEFTWQIASPDKHDCTVLS